MKKKKRYTVVSLALITALALSPTAFAKEEAADDPEATEEILEVQPIMAEDEIPEADEEVEEVEVEPTKPLYADVSDSHFALDAILFLSEKEVVSGTTEGYFEPDEPLTRAQAAKILSETLNLRATDSYTLKATDVPPSHWAIDYFTSLEEAGIMTGADGELQPNSYVTRAQMAKMLTSAFDYAAPTKFASFTDVNRSFWSYYDINILAANGVTTQENQAFRPNDATTRAQFSLFVARSLDDRFK